MSIQDISENIFLQNNPNNIYSSLQGLHDFYKGISKQKGLNFNFETNLNRDIFIICDWIRLSQILNSLLNNAIKFTNKGSVYFKVTAEEKINNMNIKFEISDSGIGISDKEKKNIFDLFYTAKSPDKKPYSGIGTGLSNAKVLAKCLGGKLSLQNSELEKGSTFLFECEFFIYPKDNIGMEILSTRKEYENYSILYVEDSNLNQTIFREYCTGYGIDLVLANNGKEGFEKFNLISFDIVVIDCYMPVMNGYQLIEKIRSYESDNHLKPSFIVALTADNSEPTRLKCEEYGFNLFITKPYNRHHFREILNEARRHN